MWRSFVLVGASWIGMALFGNAQTAINSPVSFSGNAYDFVMFVVARSGIELSIDPEALRTLGDTKIEVSALTDTNGLALIESQLASRGFVLHPFALGPEKKLTLLTTTAGMTFLRATECMRRGDIACLRGVLEGATDDGNPLSRHNFQMRQALTAIARRNEEMTVMEQRVQSTLTSFQQAKRDLQLAEMAQSNRRSGDFRVNDPVLVLGRSRFEKATNDAENCWIAINRLIDKAAENNAPVVDMFDTAYRRGYTTEARFFFEELYDSWSRLRSMLRRLQQEGIVRSERDLGKAPDEVLELHRSLRRDMEECDEAVKTALTQLRTDPDKAAATFTRAYSEDRTAPLARIGTGHADLQRSLHALHRVLDPDAAGQPIDKLDRELRESNKRGLLVALAEHRTGQSATLRWVPPTKLGAARGLSVGVDGGALFPVAVGMEHIPVKPIGTNDTHAGFWSGFLYRELESKGYPVAFGDYGEKDSYMLMSAIETYKWLRSIDTAFEGDVGLKIEFQNLLGGKAGDSAGIAFAAGGYSTLRKTPLRQDVAMTGSIRADGTIKAVGGVPIKVAGAAAADGVEIVIVPRENEPDLLMLPLDQLCRLIIVVTDDVRTCLKYATEPTSENPTAEQQEAWDCIHRLQQAQVRLQLGDRAAARDILISLAGAPSELYNVRRLLDLFTAQLMFRGETETAQNIQKQVGDIRSRQLLSPSSHDFQIASFGGVRAAIPERPALQEPSVSSNTTSAPSPDVASSSIDTWRLLTSERSSTGQFIISDTSDIVLGATPIVTSKAHSKPVTVECEVVMEKGGSYYPRNIVHSGKTVSDEWSVEMMLIPVDSILIYPPSEYIAVKILWARNVQELDSLIIEKYQRGMHSKLFSRTLPSGITVPISLKVSLQNSGIVVSIGGNSYTVGSGVAVYPDFFLGMNAGRLGQCTLRKLIVR